jgi:hypothetical protein
MLVDHPETAGYLDVMAHQRYGPMVAVPRLLRMLDRLRLRTTFFMPGWVAETWPDVARSVRCGPRDGHHGFLHESARRRRGNLRRGIPPGTRGARPVLGIRPVGYRPPSCDINYRTPDLLARHGFVYDSGLWIWTIHTGTCRASSSSRCTGRSDDWNRYNYVPGYAASLHPASERRGRRLGRGARRHRRGWRLFDSRCIRSCPGGLRGLLRSSAHRARPGDGRRVGGGRRRDRGLGGDPGPATGHP